MKRISPKYFLIHLTFALLAASAIVLFFSCGRDYQSPFLPESGSYAGPEWARDWDGNGVSDSVEKYAPGCAGESMACLDQAKAAAMDARPDTVRPGKDDTVKPVNPDKPDRHIAVTSVQAADMGMAPGEEREPEVTVSPPDASDPSYEILTHNPGVAYPRNGRLVAAGPGRTLVTIRTVDGGHQILFTCTVHQRVSSVSARSLFLKAGDAPAPPDLEILPGDATDKSYTLSGGDPGVAVVAGEGQLVAPVGAGTAAFTATVEGGLQAGFTVTVAPDDIPVRGVRVSDMAITLWTSAESRVRAPSIRWIPEDATDKGYSLESEKPDVVRVVGGSVEAVANGEAKVVLTAHDGGRKDSFKVRVTMLFGCGGVIDPCGDSGGAQGGGDGQGKPDDGGTQVGGVPQGNGGGQGDGGPQGNDGGQGDSPGGSGDTGITVVEGGGGNGGGVVTDPGAGTEGSEGTPGVSDTQVVMPEAVPADALP